MAKTSVTITWTSGSATASLKVDFTYTISETSTTWSFKLTDVSVDYAGTTGSGADLAKAQNLRTNALNQGIPIKFYYRGSDIVQGLVKGSTSNVILLATAYDTRTVTKTHAAQSVQFYGMFNAKSGTKYTQTVAAKPSYTVTYNGNGASSPAAATKWYGENLTLSGALTRVGYVFQRWNTNTSNTGTGYAAGATYTANATITLYAIWDANIYYNANGGSGGPGTVKKTFGSTHTVPPAKPTRSGYVFKCWNTKADGSGTNYYSETSTYSANATLTLYAIWNPVLTFNTNDGSGTTWTETKTYNAAHTVARTPTRANYQFAGWSTSPTATSGVTTIPASVNAPTTYYAVWQLIYTTPKISITRVYRAEYNADDDTYAADDEGTYAAVMVSWQISANTVSNNALSANQVVADGITASCNGVSASQTPASTDKSGTATFYLDTDMATDVSYTVTITVEDNGGRNTASALVPMAYYPLDILNFENGRGLAVGAPATRDGVFEIGFSDTVFALNTNEDLYTALDNLGWYSNILHSAGRVPSLKKLLTKIFDRMKSIRLTVTRVENSYCDAESVERLIAVRKDGFLFCSGNLSLSTSMPTGVTSVQIGSISGWSAYTAVNMTVAGQNGGGAITVSISASGVIEIHNQSGASAVGWHRFTVCVPVSMSSE